MRKYTSYPWCKENFFFGSYDELKEWYQTTEEIPFYVRDFVGQKFFRLTILDFLYKHNSKGLRTLHAQCKCDCGNIVDVDFWGLKHGDIRGCGCKKPKKITSVFDCFEDLVAERWDYSKNNTDPKEVEYNSETKYWWKGYQESYLMAPKELLGKPRGTSFPEQAIFFYLSRLFSNVENRAKIQCGDTRQEADIYLHDYKIAVEYDGVLWHKRKLQADINKSNYFASQNIYVIRARESGLKDFDIENGIIIEVDIDNLPYMEALAQAISKIIEIIKQRAGVSELALIDDLYSELRKDRITIESRYLQTYEKDNIANTWLISFWDEVNGIEPYKISINSIDKFYFRCNANNSILISPSAIMKIYDKVESKEDEEQMQRSLLIGDNCPFASLACCPCNALYHDSDLLTPCRAFIHYNRQSSLIKELGGYRYVHEAERDLRITPFSEYANKYLVFLKTINDYNDIAKTTLIRYITNLLFYKIPGVQDVVAEIIKMPIDSYIKQKYLETIFCYPNFGLEDVSKVFANADLLQFYFVNFDYTTMFANEGEIIPNLSHAYPLFDTLKSFVYDKKLIVFSNALEVVRNSLNDEQMDIVLLSIALQLSATYNYRYKELKSNEKAYNHFIALLTKYASITCQTKIMELMAPECLTVRIKYYQTSLEQKLTKNTLVQSEIFELQNMFRGYYGMFIQAVNNVLETFKNMPDKCDEIKKMLSADCHFTTTSDGKILWLAPKSDLSPDYIYHMTNGYASFSLEQKIETLDFIDKYLKTNGATIDISNIDDPIKYLQWFHEYGTGRFKFNLAIIARDENCSKQFFNLLLKVYDDEPGFSRLNINIGYIYEQCKDIYRSGTMPLSFLKRLKKLILYIEYHRTDLGHYQISCDYDINTLLGVEREDMNKRIVRIYDIDDPIQYRKW